MTIITPAGHAPIMPKAYSRKASILENAFADWKRDLDQDPLSSPSLEGIAFGADELHDLLLRHCQNYDPDNNSLDVFISVGYEHCRDKVILYDLDIPIHWLGICLPYNKLLINTGTAGAFFGDSARGVIINVGSTQKGMGWNTTGLVLNGGLTGKQFGHVEWNGIAIALCEPETYSLSDWGTRIRHHNIPPQIKNYLDDLVAVCKTGSAEEIYRKYGETPAIAIKKEIRSLLEVKQ